MKQPKRGRSWLNDGSCVRLRPCWPNHVWAYDFVQARTHDGQAFRMLSIIDEYTQECVAILVACRIRSNDVLHLLAEVFADRGPPDHIGSDNGLEFPAKAVRERLRRIDVKTFFIGKAEPWRPWRRVSRPNGSPRDNGFNESFNSKLRGELLNGEPFYTLKEAEAVIERWRRHHNHLRPHSELGHRHPAPETRLPRRPNPASSTWGLQPYRASTPEVSGLT